MDPKRRLSRGPHALYAEYRARGRTTRGTSNPRRPDPARRPFRSGEGGFPQTDSPVAQGASVDVSDPEGPRRGPAGFKPGAAQVYLADQLRTRQLDTHAVN